MMKGDSALSTAGYIILGILVAYGINFGLSFALNTYMPVVAVESNSMVPAFARGDILILDGWTKANLSVGDVIVYSPGSQSVPIVHRIISINADGSFQTKGDANAGQLPFEKRVDVSQVAGKMIFIIPYVGWIKIAITGYIIPNILWVIILGAALLAAYLAVRRVREGYLKRSVKI
jgi:signal peptidase I